MHLYCPKCQIATIGAERCSRCGGRLVSPAETLPLGSDMRPPPEMIRPSFAGRVIVGCVVAFGLLIGLHDWLMASCAGEETSDLTDVNTLKGFMAASSLRLIAVVVGGLMGGSGRLNGGISGAAVGLLCAIVFITIDGASGREPGVMPYIVGGILTVVGGGFGHLGSRIWPPAKEFLVPKYPSRGSSIGRLIKEEEHFRTSRPTVWGRVAVGVVFVMVGTIGAEWARDHSRKAIPKLSGEAQKPAVDLALAAIAVTLAGIIAGGNTGIGFRQGLITGLIAGPIVGLMALQGHPNLQPPIEGLMKLLDLSGGNTQGAAAFSLAIGVWCSLTGWFGGKLLPPLAPAHLFRRRSHFS